MSMHMIHGVRANTSSKRKKTNSKKLNQAKLEHDAFLRKMGIDPSGKRKVKPASTPMIDRLRAQETKTEEKPSNISYSNAIPGNGSKKETIRYTGDEIMGVALMHKQAYEPIRKDNKEAAVQSSQMRRS